MKNLIMSSGLILPSLVIAALIMLLGCNNEIKDNNLNESAATSTVEPWPEEYRQAFMDGCVDSATESKQATWANDYCACILVKASRKYSAEDFVENEAKYSQDLIDEGEVDTCFMVADNKTLESPPDTNDEITVNVDTDVSVTINHVTGQTTAGDQCQAGKLCRGMTKADVLDIVGEPHTIASNTYDASKTTWHWSESGGFNSVCVETYTYLSDRCSLEFVDKFVGGKKVSILVRAENFQAVLLDPLNY